MQPYKPGNELTVGSTQMGKSTAELLKIVSAADQEVAIVEIDPHGTLFDKTLLQLTARGHEHRILTDKLTDFEHTIGYRFLRPSMSRNPDERLSANRQTCRHFIDIASRRRDIADIAKNPQIEKWALNAAQLVLNQDRERPPTDMLYATRPSHPKFRELVNHCTDPELRQEFEEAARKGGREIASAERFIAPVCGEPAFRLRCGKFDLGDFLQKKGILLIAGGTLGVSADAIRTIMGAIIIEVIHFIHARWERTKSPHPRVLLILDEANNWNLLGASGHEVRALAETQKMGLDVHILVQNLNFPNKDITDQVLTNCTTHVWFHNSNPDVASKANADLGPYHTQVMKFDRHGTSTIKHHTLRSYHKDEVRKLRVGECFVRRKATVTRETIVPLEDPWTLSELSKLKTAQAQERIWQRPEYNPPEMEAETVGSEKPKKEKTETRKTSAPTETPAQRLSMFQIPKEAIAPYGVIASTHHRDKTILKLAETHVCISDHFMPLFNSKSTATNAISRLKKEKKLKHRGTVQREAKDKSSKGRSPVAYCNGWQPKQNHLRHEVLLTDFLLACFPQAPTVRGYEAVNKQIRPDAEIRFGEQLFYVELDTGSESPKVVKDRMKRYSGVLNDFLLFITDDPTRLENMKLFESVKDIAVITTLDQALNDPRGEIWIDWYGNKTCF